jgi:hypothetical protein
MKQDHMKQGSNSRRSRGRGNGKRPQKNHNFDSSGPEGRVRGNAQQVYEKYVGLARDAQLAGDRIATENYYQHAEHYLRVLMAQDNGDGRMEAFRQRQQRLNENDFGDDGEDGDELAAGPQNRPQHAQQGGQQASYQGEGRQPNEGRHDDRQDGRQDNRQEGRGQEGRTQEGRQDGRREGRDRNEGRHNRNNGEGRGEARNAEGRGEGEGPREGREGGNGRRVPIERATDANRATDDEPDDDGLRRTLAL